MSYYEYILDQLYSDYGICYSNYSSSEDLAEAIEDFIEEELHQPMLLLMELLFVILIT